MSLKIKKDCPNCQGRIKEVPEIVEKIKKIRWNKEYELLTKLDFSCRGCDYVWSTFPCVDKTLEPEEIKEEGIDFDYRRSLLSGNYELPGCHGDCKKTRRDMWGQNQNWLKNLKTGKDENFCDDCFSIFSYQEKLYYKYPD